MVLGRPEGRVARQDHPRVGILRPDDIGESTECEMNVVPFRPIGGIFRIEPLLPVRQVGLQIQFVAEFPTENTLVFPQSRYDVLGVPHEETDCPATCFSPAAVRFAVVERNGRVVPEKARDQADFALLGISGDFAKRSQVVVPVIRIGGEFLAVKDAAIETDDADALFFQYIQRSVGVGKVDSAVFQAIRKKAVAVHSGSMVFPAGQANDRFRNGIYARCGHIFYIESFADAFVVPVTGLQVGNTGSLVGRTIAACGRQYGQQQ